MNILLNSGILTKQISDFYAKKGVNNVSISIKPVDLSGHYEKVFDTAITVSANGETRILDEYDLAYILNSQMKDNGYHVEKAYCSTKCVDGKPKFCGVNAIVNEEKEEVLTRSR